MAHVGKARLQAGADLHHLAVVAALELPHGIDGVLHRVQRLIQGRAAALRLAVAPLGFKLLNVARVPQHDVAQAGGDVGGINRAAIPLFDHQRNAPGMVDVRMGQQNAVQLSGCHGQGLILINVAALLHAAINQIIAPVGRQQRAATGYFMGSAQKGQFHRESLLFRLADWSAGPVPSAGQPPGPSGYGFVFFIIQHSPQNFDTLVLIFV